jgi:hypothetical protein
MVRITSLAKTITSIENTIDVFLKSEFVGRTPAEKKAFKQGFTTAFDLLRSTYGINKPTEQKE